LALFRPERFSEFRVAGWGAGISLKLASSGNIGAALQNQPLTVGEGKPKRARASQIFSSSGVRAALIAVLFRHFHLAWVSGPPLIDVSFRQNDSRPSVAGW